MHYYFSCFEIHFSVKFYGNHKPNLNDDIRNGNYEIIKLSKQRQTAYNF